MTRVRTAGLPLALLLSLGAAGQTTLREAPPATATLLPASIRLSEGDLRDLAEGKTVIEKIDNDVRHETVVFAMARIDVPPALFTRLYPQLEYQIETNHADLYGSIGPAAAEADFHELRMVDKDHRDLPRCRVTDCKVKLDAVWIRRFLEEVDWEESSSDLQADALFRKLLAGLARDYQTRGNAALLRANDKSATVMIAEQVQGTLDNAATLRRLYPELYEHLSRYPDRRLDHSVDQLFWMRDDIGTNKPAISLVHRVVYRPAGGEVVLVTKQFYANHYFESSLGFTIMVPAPAGGGVYLLHVYRARLDTLRGFGLFHGRLRSGVRKLVRSRIERTKERLEAAILGGS